jgi:hypothetical protein
MVPHDAGVHEGHGCLVGRVAGRARLAGVEALEQVEPEGALRNDGAGGLVEVNGCRGVLGVTGQGTSISPDTLKRLFGKTKTYRSYNPQLETKNALALFIGYEGWEDFKKRQPVLTGEGRLPVPAAPPAPGLSPPGRKPWRLPRSK